MEQLYRPIFKAALDKVWHYKFLWFFGLFAAILGNGGEYNMVISNLGKIGEEGTWLEALKMIYNNNSFMFSLATIKNIFIDFNFISALILVGIVFLFVFIIWLIIVSQAGLLGSLYNIFQNKDKNTGFLATLKLGKQFFWPVIGYNFIAKFLIYFLLAVISLPLVYLYLSTGGSGIMWYSIISLSFILLIPGTFIIALVARYAIIELVSGQGHSFIASLNFGWTFFRKNWLVSLETAFLLFIINVCAGFLLIVALLIVLLPFVLVGAVALYTQLVSLFQTMLGLGLIVFFAVVIFFGAMLSVFQNSVWVKIFIELTQGSAVAKLMRWFSKPNV